MSSFANALIDHMGGTREVSRMTDAPESSVSGWRSGLTGSRLNHLVRTARMERPALDLQALAREHGVALPAGVRLDGEDRETDHASVADTGALAPSAGNDGVRSPEAAHA
jgi:hypothetical protein